MDEEKKAQVEELLRRPGLLAHIGSVNPKTNQPHITLVWYLWDGEAVWFSGFRSTRKFRELIANPKCAVLVEPANLKESKLQAVLLEGTAEIITEPREVVEEMSQRIYVRYLGEEGAQAAEPQSWKRDPENMVVRLKPAKVYAW